MPWPAFLSPWSSADASAGTMNMARAGIIINTASFFM
jgi:hypothetical protein